MNVRFFVFRDYSNIRYLPISAPDGVDIEESFGLAVQDAVADGLCFNISSIPKHYLEKYGLKVLPKELIHETYDHSYGQTAMDEIGMDYATCRKCNSFEDGSCYKYGGICNPDGIEDCLHAEYIFILRYGDKDICYLDLGDSSTKIDVILAAICSMKDETSEEILSIQNMGTYDPALWKLEKTI